MRKFRAFLSGATLALVVLVPTYVAQAATVTYGFKLEGQDNYIFDLPANPVPLGYSITGGYFYLRSPAGLPANSYITFYTADQGGGLSVQTEPTITWTSTSLLSAPFLDNYHPGTALFTGSVDAPVFPAPSPGSYYIRYLTWGSTTFPIWDDLFVISNVASAEPPAVPLPAALPLFATGLGVLGLLGWRRKRKASGLVMPDKTSSRRLARPRDIQ